MDKILCGSLCLGFELCIHGAPKSEVLRASKGLNLTLQIPSIVNLHIQRLWMLPDKEWEMSFPKPKHEWQPFGSIVLVGYCLNH